MIAAIILISIAVILTIILAVFDLIRYRLGKKLESLFGGDSDIAESDPRYSKYNTLKAKYYTIKSWFEVLSLAVPFSYFILFIIGLFISSFA